jgi:type VI secretion system protein
LLDRIGAEDPRLGTRVLDSIVENLHAILNTHEGDGHTCPDLGVDFIDLLARWPSSENDVLRAVRHTIERYEPRLKNVHVRRLPDDGSTTVTLEISGELETRGRVKLRTELRNTGRVLVR